MCGPILPIHRCFKQQLTDAVLRYGPDSDADNATVDKSFGPAGATTRLQMLLWLDQLPTDSTWYHKRHRRAVTGHILYFMSNVRSLLSPLSITVVMLFCVQTCTPIS